MGKFVPRRPSPSMIVALLVLAVALGGTASAGVPARISRLISGSRIKPQSIPGNRIKDNTLTGRQIEESALGEVPNAKVAASAAYAATAGNAVHAGNADIAASAETANNAAKLGGLGASGYFLSTNGVRYSAAMEKGDPEKTLATVGPLILTGSCTDDAGKTKAVLSATPNVDGVWLIGNTLNSGESAVVQELDTSEVDKERVLPIVTAFDSAQSFAIEGVSTTVANALGKDCRFFGILTEDTG